MPGLPGIRVAAHREVGSTNALALEAAARGEAGGLWIVGGLQTAGRARRARSWMSEPGNLYATYLGIDPGPSERLAQLPLVAAIALSEAVDRMCGTLRLARLKWPNDLLVDGAKISGILLEATQLADGRRAVVFGFGLNLVHHPDLADYRAADLAGLGYQIDVERAFLELARALEARLSSWRERPFAVQIEDWLERSVGVGGPIRVRLDKCETSGIFQGLDGEGRLMLRRDDGTVSVISAGDVFFANMT